ncbi:hypothetical protein [Planctomycetes bacterium K23_9]|uniref:Transmembrane protein n=1 Tax=Stieleria marina TaxID=1930275 RepID=A0A517NPA0_9BACT|nr:hypothetical protein K239x_08870 [Planctomycetes bacterium K23_9]
MSRRRRSTLEMGHDSFLDIVANLVGILIILVVILGTQSQAVLQSVQDTQEEEQADAPEATFATEQQLTALASHTMRAQAAQADSNRFEKKILLMDDELEARKRQRGMLLDLLAQAKLAYEDIKKKSDADKTRIAAQQAEVQSLMSRISDISAKRNRLESEKQPVVAVEHLPTPMAKTVFGEELHFRLKGNRLSLVPVEKLLVEIRRDFARAAAGPRDGRIDAAVGPVRGYVARYIMDKQRKMVSNGRGVSPGTQIQLVRMKVEPLSEPYGEPIESVLSGGQMLDVELAGRKPNATTITVWVYPDSFAAFRRLKEHLYAKGFATAARPLPMDRSITGGPQGSRSAAQ